jgi:hypothetical protein
VEVSIIPKIDGGQREDTQHECHREDKAEAAELDQHERMESILVQQEDQQRKLGGQVS